MEPQNQNQEKELQDLTIKEFIGATASKAPVPGGGSVAAVCGALSAALGQMVTGLTIGRKKYADVEEMMTRLADTFAEAKTMLLGLADVDAHSYQMVMDAYKLPKETDEERQKRDLIIQECLKMAAQTPLTVAGISQSLMPHIAQVATHGNQNAVTDACVAMMAARTAVWGAILNVRINLQSMTDEAVVKGMNDECDKLWNAALEAEQSLLSTIKL